MDSFAEKNGKPDLIKMDIEGSEYRALMGAKNLLREAHPLIFLATHGSNIHQKCVELLRSYGYIITTISLSDDEIIAVHTS